MARRISLARTAPAVVCASLLLILFAAPGAPASTIAELRVLTPTEVLDPGTNYVINDRITVPTRPEADCFGPPGGSGAEYSLSEPVALGLLASGARATGSLRPLSISDQFGFGLLICGIGGIESEPGSSFWYLKRNHQEATVGADQLQVSDGDEVLFYLAPDNYPDPNPKELELIAPARAVVGSPFQVQVLEHGCVTDPNTYEVSCETLPAAGVTVSGAAQPALTGADGTATIAPLERGRLKLTGTRGADIPSKTLPVCVGESLEDCPAARGERFVGGPDRDRLRGTRGADSFRGRGGRDRIDLRRGGPDRVDCGPDRDTVLLGRAGGDDDIARDCERVRTG